MATDDELLTKMAMMIGIDLGTTNSAMAGIDGGKPVTIPNAEGERVTPSVTAFDPITGQLVVGTPAKRQAETNPQNTVFSIKRFVGRRFNDPDIQRDLKLAPYEIRAADNGGISILMGDKWHSPSEILAMVLRKLKRDAEASLGEPVTKVVITVPAYFNGCQREATKEACRIAGLDVLRIISEPAAASLAYGLGREVDKKVAVYHLGGGTLDVSILHVSHGVFEVIATSGDTSLGGDDFDHRIIDWACDEFKKQKGVDLRDDRVALQRLKWAAERAKCELSTTRQVEINLPHISEHGGNNDLSLTLTRTTLEALVRNLIGETLVPCNQALVDAGITHHDIDELVLVGQQTRMPAVEEALRTLFYRDPRRVIQPAEVVAWGAAIQAGVLAGQVKDILLLDVTPLTLSIESRGGVAIPLIECNTMIPTRCTKMFTTAKDDQTIIDINVLQGEHKMAADNVLLGQVRLEDIPTAPKGKPQIDVTFDIDANGTLDVSAHNKSAGRETRALIVPPDTLMSQEELEEAQFGKLTEPVTNPYDRLPVPADKRMVYAAAAVGGGGLLVLLEHIFHIFKIVAEWFGGQ